jgi:hypothetical protein
VQLTSPLVQLTSPVKVNSGKRRLIAAICAVYLILAGIFSATTLDGDEFSFVREPYEILGGDYTVGYLQRHEYTDAIRTLVKSYYFFWYYRPLNAPVIREDHRSMFQSEERDFGYVMPTSVQYGDPAAFDKYKARAQVIVPEPDRFYKHGAGKPLLPALLSIPQLALVKLFGIGPERILDAQFRQRYDPVFIIFRLVQIFAGLASTLLVFKILESKVDIERAYLGTLIFAMFPITIKCFPNLHHDSIMVPFILLALYLQVRERYVAAGISYGLALASKNLAIIFFPALTADVAIQAIRTWNETNSTAALAFLRARLAGLTILGAVAFATLLPFANPISYAQEIVTPLVGRTSDPRGENISQWTVDGIVSQQSKLSPQVAFAKKFLYFNDLGFFFFVLALFLAIQQPLTNVSRISISLFVLYLPLAPIFGPLLEYRTLLLVPFFAVVAAELLQPRHLRWLAGVIAILALIYVSDPSRTDFDHKHYVGNQMHDSGKQERPNIEN